MATSNDDDDQFEAAIADVPTERTPLVRAGSVHEATAEVLGDPKSLYRQNVLILTFVILFLVDTGSNIMAPPMIEVMESALCRQRYPEQAGLLLAGDPDSPCKGPDVQGRLVMIRAWMSTIECIPGILLAVPFGVLADHWGRRPVLFLAVLGIVIQYLLIYVVLAFPDTFSLWWTCAAALARLIGGGNNVAVAMMYTCLADVVAVADRATVFFQVAAVDLSTQVIGNPLAGMMMQVNPWLALLVGMGMMIVANLAILLMPETNDLHKETRERARARHDADQPANGDKSDTPIRQALHRARASLGEAWNFILENRRVTFLVMSLVFVVLGRFVNDLLLQYATKRYHWSWAEATYLLTVSSASNVVVLLAVLPALSWLCVSVFGMPAMAKDLLLARCSAAAYILGSLVIAMAVNGYLLAVGLVIFSCGVGMSSLVRSLANALIEEHHIGTLNTLVGMIDSIALMIASPLLSSTLSIGFRIGGPWMGLPFIAAAGMFSLSLLVTLWYRIPPTKLATVRPEV